MCSIVYCREINYHLAADGVGLFLILSEIHCFHILLVVAARSRGAARLSTDRPEQFRVSVMTRDASNCTVRSRETSVQSPGMTLNAVRVPIARDRFGERAKSRKDSFPRSPRETRIDSAIVRL